MQRFFYPYVNGSQKMVLDDVDIMYQILKVLRMRVGEQVVFFDGKAMIDYVYTLQEIRKKELVFHIFQVLQKSGVSVDIRLYQALPNKMDKIEDILLKGGQVGIQSFVFFRAYRSQKLHMSENKMERLQRILVESIEQSGGNMIPEIIFEDDIDIAKITGTTLFFHTQDDSSQKLSDIIISPSLPTNIFVGPEGGFSPEEIAFFEQFHFKKVFLGNRILRTETVGIVTAFYLMQKGIEH